MIEFKDLTLDYGRGELLSHVNGYIKDGETTALIGRNGSGKSTLLRAIATLNKRYSGTITVSGVDIRYIKPCRMARLLAFVNTERIRIPDLTSLQVTAMGRAPMTDWLGRLTDEDRNAAYDALKAVGMESYADREMGTMSDGECQRIMIARAIAQDTPAILLDEPTSFLDLPNRYELVALLKNLAHNKGKCIMFSTHELDIALKTCDRIALIDNGTLHILTPAELIESRLLNNLFSTSTISISEILGI